MEFQDQVNMIKSNRLKEMENISTPNIRAQAHLLSIQDKRDF